ncbi:hypothetical protein GJ496_010873 [Pomphorhynchus laevis]|nr:hypothetical protein GJ496_010873 [Pomphorhynchus laevis]
MNSSESITLCNNTNSLMSSESSNLLASNTHGSMLIDYYEIKMVYALWMNGKHEQHAVFEAFFRRCPFGGEFCIFAGLSECLNLIKKFQYSSDNLNWLKNALPPDVNPMFFTYLQNIKMNDIELYAIAEGSPVFPHTPLIVVYGPIGKVQLLETAIINSINYASLVATNAARYRHCTPASVKLSEFGARKAQGPNGALTASKYSYLGGFDSTSNVLAAKLYNIPLSGTLAHSFIMSYRSIEDLGNTVLKNNGICLDIKSESEKYLAELLSDIPLFLNASTNKGELAAFIAFAIAYPHSFVVVIDTYNVLISGLPNFCAVALCIISLGYQPIGVRLDSGDLIYLSKEVRNIFKLCSEKYLFAAEAFNNLDIILSNDLTLDTLANLNSDSDRESGSNPNTVTACGVGTHLVTCFKQPALGVVLKLVEIGGRPVVKISEDHQKMSIPGSKSLFRIYGQDDIAICDLMTTCAYDEIPMINEPYFVRHPFIFSKRTNVIPTTFENLLNLYWSGGKLQRTLPSLQESRSFCMDSMKKIRKDHTRLIDPRTYKVSLSSKLYQRTQQILDETLPLSSLR